MLLAGHKVGVCISQVRYAIGAGMSLIGYRPASD